MINNQVGFTTLPGEARSSWHASDVAKAVKAPVWHANAGAAQLLQPLCSSCYWWSAKGARALPIWCSRVSWGSVVCHEW